MKLLHKTFDIIRDIPADSHNINISENCLQFNTLVTDNYRIRRLVEADKAEIIELADDERVLVTINLTLL